MNKVCSCLQYLELSRELGSKYESWAQSGDAAQKGGGGGGGGSGAGGGAGPAPLGGGGEAALERMISRELRRAREEAGRELREIKKMLRKMVGDKEL